MQYREGACKQSKRIHDKYPRATRHTSYIRNVRLQSISSYGTVDMNNTFEGTFVLSYFRKYNYLRTFVRKYESTKVPSYESTKVRKYLRIYLRRYHFYFRKYVYSCTRTVRVHAQHHSLRVPFFIWKHTVRDYGIPEQYTYVYSCTRTISHPTHVRVGLNINWLNVHTVHCRLS